MMSRYALLFPVLLLSACTAFPPPRTPAPVNETAPPSGTSALLDALVRVPVNLSDEQRRADIARLENERAVTSRFRLALLLGRDDDPVAVERGIKVLSGLEGDSKSAQALIDLARAQLKSRLDALRHHARAEELQLRIEQIKALEKSLHQRDSSPATR
jgi:hypothetical protein